MSFVVSHIKDWFKNLFAGSPVSLFTSIWFLFRLVDSLSAFWKNPTHTQLSALLSLSARIAIWLFVLVSLNLLAGQFSGDDSDKTKEVDEADQN